MSTVAQVIDRILRDWLYAPDDQPTQFTLAAQLTAGSTTLSYSAALLSPEEEDLLGPGALIEIGSEQIRVGTVDADANTITGLGRGANGTTDATHASGALVTIAPTWSRKTVFDAVADAVEQLWPDLYAVDTTDPLTISSTGYTEVPATVMEPMWLWARPTGATTWAQFSNVGLLDHFPPSSTGKAITTDALPSGATAYLVHRKKFVRPTAESDDLTATCLLIAAWEQLVIIAVAAYLISGRDLSAATQEFLTEQLAQEGFPVDSGRRIRDGLIRYHQFLLNKAKADLRARYRATVTMEHW